MANNDDTGGDGALIPSPFTEAEEHSPFVENTSVGELFQVIQQCCRAIEESFRVYPATDEASGDRFDKATLRILGYHLIRLLQGIDELLMRSTEPGLDNSQKHMVYQTAISAFAKVITVYWPEIDNSTEDSQVLRQNMEHAQGQIVHETGRPINDVFQDIKSRLRALRLTFGNP